MKLYQPLKNTWSINEDKGYVPEQIQERVNSESNYIWAINNDLTASERSKYFREIGENYKLIK